MKSFSSFTFAIAFTFALNGYLAPAQALASGREVRVYSGRHYNTDRKVFKEEYQIQSQCYAFGEPTKHFFVNDKQCYEVKQRNKRYSI